MYLNIYIFICFCIFLCINSNGIVQIWISEKDNKFLIEFREAGCDKLCEKELECSQINNESEFIENMRKAVSGEELEELYRKRVASIKNPLDIYDIIATKEVLRSTTISSQRELFKFLNK